MGNSMLSPHDVTGRFLEAGATAGLEVDDRWSADLSSERTLSMARTKHIFKRIRYVPVNLVARLTQSRRQSEDGKHADRI